MSLHDGEVPADEGVVRALLQEQAPRLAALPIIPLSTTGTVNRVFRLGAELAVRLPLTADGADDPAREAALLPLVAPVLAVAVPETVLLGRPGAGFPFAWSVVRWVDGDVPAPSGVPVDDLADAVLALRTVAVQQMPRAGRPTAAEADPHVRAAIAALSGIDRAAVTAAWEDALAAPAWDGVPVPIHADLLPPNLLVRDDRLAGILDWGGAGAGDPANDLVPAWSVLRGADRVRWFERLRADAGAVRRARGIALAQAVVAIPYYEQTLPAFAALNRATLAEVLADRR